jgi:DNA invertase Pin-like site-specific DNA recombinase
MSTVGSTGRAIGYLRCSTNAQTESGLGLEAQRASVTACAALLGLPLGAVLCDAGTSGSLTIEDRPVLLDAVASLKRGDVLIVAKRDRLGRDVIAVAMIERLVTKRGARIVSAAGEGGDSNDPSSLLMKRMIDSFGEYERLIIGVRTKAALAAKRARGERTSRFAPFGYAIGTDGRTVSPAPIEQQTLVVMRERRAAGDSHQTIATYLNQRGIYTRAGGLWRHQYIHSALRRVA